ncbi:hypothetical protein GQX74_004017 [Glossina fuscipes]|nr:hypothetical protein GQX74_004017 [Glossina fuscipes]
MSLKTRLDYIELVKKKSTRAEINKISHHYYPPISQRNCRFNNRLSAKLAMTVPTRNESAAQIIIGEFLLVHLLLLLLQVADANPIQSFIKMMMKALIAYGSISGN